MPKAHLVGSGMAGLVDAAVDGAAEVFDEGAEQPRIDHPDPECGIRDDFGRFHNLRFPFSLYLQVVSPAWDSVEKRAHGGDIEVKLLAVRRMPRTRDVHRCDVWGQACDLGR